MIMRMAGYFCYGEVLYIWAQLVSLFSTLLNSLFVQISLREESAYKTSVYMAKSILELKLTERFTV